jgi:hypothetical protein
MYSGSSKFPSFLLCYFCSLLFLILFKMSSDAALSSAPIHTSVPVPASNEVYDAEDANSNSLAVVGVIIVDDSHDAIHPLEMDCVDDMLALPHSSSELPSRIITTKQSLSEVSGSAKSWVWSHCLCLICNTEVNYSYTKSTGALGRHIKKIIYLSGNSTFMKKLRFLSLLALAAPAHCPLTLL